MKYNNIREEEIKNSVATDFFGQFDCDKIVGFIDFAVKLKRPKNTLDFNDEYLLWAEAKTGSHDIYAMFTQLVLTIGKARTFDKYLPPPFLGCFDSEKIAFVPYSEIQDIFYQNDFNWKVTPSNTETKEFKQVYAQTQKILDNDIPWETYLFDFEKDEKELQRFIKQNFIVGKKGTTKTQIDKNNFVIIYNKWLAMVKPTIAINWDVVKQNNIIDGDFYLADLLSNQNTTIKENLFVVLKATHYEANRHIDTFGMFASNTINFKDKQKAYNQFWNKYERPPKEEYWDYIVERRDLLVPQDVRERKGSFFTPQIWVELSQKYIADALGKDWQDEYYVWDCAAGTGNLLVGLVNKDRIFASTLDKQDVDVMHERIANGANLWQNQVFQFDFLNDDFLPQSKGGKLPNELYDIISGEQKRPKLIIYINPPYAEAASSKTITSTGSNKKGVSIAHKIHNKYISIIGNAINELSAQFTTRIYGEIPDAKLALFSKLAYLNGANYKKFRIFFQAKFKRGFIVPSYTFDNVSGKFPIGFLIWDTENRKRISKIKVDVYEKNNIFIKQKSFYALGKGKYINDWYRLFYDDENVSFGIMNTRGNDVQNQNYIRISSDNNFNHTNPITINNFIQSCIYFTVRKIIEATWLNDRDQFLYPNSKWEKDLEFQNECLTYTLFNNNIQSKFGKNHWIPFRESEVGAAHKFDSHFMVDFINGKLMQNGYSTLFEQQEDKLCIIRKFSLEAKTVFDAGRVLWEYYHQQSACNPNAALYDIREHFQGRNEQGKMNSGSNDETYTALIRNLRDNIRLLAKKIEPKVYEYGFLKR